MANGCTPGEVATAIEKAEELVPKYDIDPGQFRWPPRPSTLFGSATSGPNAPKPPRSSDASRGKGIRKLAEPLIVEHPDCTYRRIAEEVNAQIEGAAASEKSVGGTRASLGNASEAREQDGEFASGAGMKTPATGDGTTSTMLSAAS
jgi:hypothetical protein